MRGRGELPGLHPRHARRRAEDAAVGRGDHGRSRRATIARIAREYATIKPGDALPGLRDAAARVRRAGRAGGLRAGRHHRQRRHPGRMGQRPGEHARRRLAVVRVPDGRRIRSPRASRCSCGAKPCSTARTMGPAARRHRRRSPRQRHQAHLRGRLQLPRQSARRHQSHRRDSARRVARSSSSSCRTSSSRPPRSSPTSCCRPARSSRPGASRTAGSTRRKCSSCPRSWSRRARRAATTAFARTSRNGSASARPSRRAATSAPGWNGVSTTIGRRGSPTCPRWTPSKPRTPASTASPSTRPAIAFEDFRRGPGGASPGHAVREDRDLFQAPLRPRPARRDSGGAEVRPGMGEPLRSRGGAVPASGHRAPHPAPGPFDARQQRLAGGGVPPARVHQSGGRIASAASSTATRQGLERPGRDGPALPRDASASCRASWTFPRAPGGSRMRRAWTGGGTINVLTSQRWTPARVRHGAAHGDGAESEKA